MADDDCYDDDDDFYAYDDYDNGCDYDYEPDYSSLDFQMNGYGGFGYDTNHVPADDPVPSIVNAARAGLFEQVKQLVEDASVPGCPLCDKKTNLLTCGKCKAMSYCGKEHQKMHWKQHKKVCSNAKNEHVLPKDAGKRRVLNASQRWTEVDYKMSGFTKEYEWHGLTPLAAAANCGHAHIVQYLLEQGADPTLAGCLSEDTHYNALRAAQAALNEFDRTIDSLVKDETRMNQVKPFVQGKEPEEGALAILSRRTELMRSVALLEAAAPLWETNTSMNYQHSRYSKTREESGYPNNPSDIDALRVAVAGLCISPTDSSSDQRITKELLAPHIKILQDKEAARK
jgi:hypothetical protein